MLINLSNHSSDRWLEEQKSQACEHWVSVLDMNFPSIDPKATTAEVKAVAEEYCQRCIELLATGEKPSAVHLMGEMVFCYHLATLLKEKGVCVVASTTMRNVHYTGSIKESSFVFVTFREY